MSETCVIYYSFEGNTEMIATHLARFAEADLVRIKAKKEPPKKGLGKFLKGGAGVVMGKKAEITPTHVNLEGYQNVILCYPIWAGSYPPAINTFLDENEITSNLYVITSSSGGNGEKSVLNVERQSGTKVRDSLHLKNPKKDSNKAKKIAEAFIVKNGI